MEGLEVVALVNSHDQEGVQVVNPVEAFLQAALVAEAQRGLVACAQDQVERL